MLLRWSVLLRFVTFLAATLIIYIILSPNQPELAHNGRMVEWSDRPIPPRQPYAYMNLCANMRAVFPSLVLFEQLRLQNCSRADFVVLLPRQLNEQVGELFSGFGVRRVVYDDTHPLFPIPYQVNQPSTLKRDAMLWQKLRAWNATEYRKVVLLDNDILVMKSIDDLFQFPELSGVPQLYEGEKIMFWEPTNLDQFIPISEDSEHDSINRNGLNGGVMVIEPNRDTFNELLLSAKQLTNRTCCPSQEFLFRHYQRKGKYNRLSMEYNARKLHKLSVKRANLQSIKVYHFVEKRKPLLLGRRDSQTDTMAMAWWRVADIVDDLLDDYVRSNQNAFSVVIRVREAAIAPELGICDHNNPLRPGSEYSFTVEMSEGKRSKAPSDKRSFLVPVKSVGQVVDGSVTPSLYHRGGMWFSAVVSGESSFNIVSLDTLHTVFTVNIPDGERMTAIASKDDLTVVSVESGKFMCFDRADLRWSVKGHLKECNKIFVFEDFFVAADFSEGKVEIRDCKSGNLMRTLTVKGQIGAVIHPNTYLNKFLFGYATGDLELWNVKTGELVHSFNHAGSSANTTFNTSVTVLSQSPDADIIAVGRADQSVTVMSIRDGSVLGQLRCASVPTAIAFRYDSPADDTQMMTGDEGGELIVWSIKGKARPICRLSQAHRGPIAFAALLNGQPIIVSFGRHDNAMKEWIVEAEGKEVRLLRSREGPASAISQIAFTNGPIEDTELVCVSDRDDSIVSLSLGLDTKIHRTRIHIPTTTTGMIIDANVQVATMALSMCDVNLGWDDAVVAFTGQPFARTMSKRKNASGKHLITTSDRQPITLTACSRCGHFAAVASAAGLVTVFNLQSGRVRVECQVDGVPLLLCFDSVSRRLIVASQSGVVSVISMAANGSMAAKGITNTVDLAFTIKSAIFHTDSNTAFMLSADDYSVAMFDVDLMRVVRRLDTPTGIVTAMCVTPDSKWLLTGQPNGMVLLWDLISGIMIGQLPLLKRAIRTMAVSPDGQFVATVGAGCNHADLFWFLPHHIISTLAAGVSPVIMNGCEAATDDELLQTMSTSRFLSFINYQTLREQNRPKVPLKKASTAPFFLSELAAAAGNKVDVTMDDDDGAVKTLQLSESATIEEAKRFLLEATVSQIHDEVMLADKSVLSLLSKALNDLSADPKLFDRCLAVCTVMLRHSRADGLVVGETVGETVGNLCNHWQVCHDLIHSSLNVIRFCKSGGSH